MLNKVENAKKLYIDAGKDLKIHKISKRVTLLILLKKIELEMLPHLKILTFLDPIGSLVFTFVS